MKITLTVEIETTQFVTSLEQAQRLAEEKLKRNSYGDPPDFESVRITSAKEIAPPKEYPRLREQMQLIGATALQVVEICYQERYNGANFDLKLLNASGGSLEGEGEVDSLIEEMSEELTELMLDQLEDDRFHGATDSEPLVEFARKLGLRCVDTKGELIQGNIDFEIGHDS